MDLKIYYSLGLLFHYFSILNYIWIFEIQHAFLKLIVKSNSASVTNVKEHFPSHGVSISFNVIRTNVLLSAHDFLTQEDMTLSHHII